MSAIGSRNSGNGNGSAKKRASRRKHAPRPVRAPRPRGALQRGAMDPGELRVAFPAADAAELRIASEYVSSTLLLQGCELALMRLLEQTVVRDAHGTLAVATSMRDIARTTARIRGALEAHLARLKK